MDVTVLLHSIFSLLAAIAHGQPGIPPIGV
jgi:hypothetical protein